MSTKPKKTDTPEAPQATIDHINTLLNEIKKILDDYSQFINTVEHMKLNEEGNNKLSFLDCAQKLAAQSGEFFPHFLTLERFETDTQYFTDFRSLIDLTSQIQEKLWNMTIKSADIARKEMIA